MTITRRTLSFLTKQVRAWGYDVHVAPGKRPEPLADRIAALTGTARSLLNVALAKRGLQLVPLAKPARKKPAPKPKAKPAK